MTNPLKEEIHEDGRLIAKWNREEAKWDSQSHDEDVWKKYGVETHNAFMKEWLEEQREERGEY